MATPERPIPDRDPDYIVNPTVNSPTYVTEPRRSRGMGGIAAAAIIAVVAFLAFAIFSGNDDQTANAPGDTNTTIVEGTENPPTGSIANDTAAPADPAATTGAGATTTPPADAAPADAAPVEEPAAAPAPSPATPAPAEQ